MKNIIPFSITAMLFCTLLLSSCAKEDEPQPEIPASTDPRAAFRGHWYMSEHSSANGHSTYYVDITDSSNAAYIQFAYLDGYHTKVHATVSGSSLTIPSQVVEGNNISGAGTLAGTNQINLNYLIWLGGANYDTITASLTK